MIFTFLSYICIYCEWRIRIKSPEQSDWNFKYTFEEVFIQTLINRMNENEDVFGKIMVNSEFKNDI
jgi:hypothetical protein